MGKESEVQRDVEFVVDQLLLRKVTGNDTVSHSYSKTEQPSSIALEFQSDPQEKKKENAFTDRTLQNQQNSHFTTDLTEKYRLIALNTSDLIAFTTFDMNPTFTFVSPSHKKILGYTETDLLGQPGLNFIHEDDAEDIMSILLTYLEAKMNNALTPDMLTTAKNIDFRFRDKTGQWHFLQSTVDIVKNELLFISKDITEHKKSQEALVESERKYRTLYDNLRDGIAAVDLNGKITECNAVFLDMLGYLLDEIRELTYEDITPMKWHNLENKMLNEQVKKRGYSDLYEKEYIRKNGTVFPVELQTYAVNDSQNKHCGYWAFVRDITIRKKMDLEQKENQERIRAIVMNAPIGIAVSSPNAQFISANDAFCKILGYSESELQTMSFKDITHADDLKESKRMMEDLNAGRISSFCQEKRYIKKDKSVIVGKVIVSMIRGQQNSPSLNIAQLEDITSRKQMDEALKKSEEKFVKAFNSSPVAICITRISDGRFIEVNESFEKLSGYSRTELMIASSIELNLWVDFDDRKQVVEQIKRTGSVHDTEYRFRDKKGNGLFIRYSGEIIDFNGELCCLSVLVDATERKKMEESLRVSEEKYRSIVENTQDIIMLTNPSGQVEYISPACFDVLGYRPEEITEKPQDIFHPDDIEKIQNVLSLAVQGKIRSNMEYRVITKNGEIRWVSHSWSPILSENNLLKYIVSIIRNITESKLTEQKLKVKIDELERYKNVTVNREVKMIDLKKENTLLKDMIKELERRN